MKRIVLVYILLFFAGRLGAQDKSNKGKEFWLGYGHSYTFDYPDGATPQNSQNLRLYISAEEAATVTVSVNGTAWSQTVTIPANTVNATIIVPKSGPEDARLREEGLSTKGVHIVSSVPIVVYAHEYNTQLSGATMLMPVETYGYSYYSVNYTQSPFGFEAYSWFFIVASENNTRVEITPANNTKGGWLKGSTYTVNLNKGEIYNVFGETEPSAEGDGNLVGKDMTGSKAMSVAGADGKCHPVALFSGSSIIRFCAGDGGEIMKQQVFPASAWGTRYLTWHMLVNDKSDITSPFPNFYRVVVKDPSTVVTRNGVPLTGLINNFYYEFESSDGDYIEANQPVLMAQFSPNQNQCVVRPNYDFAPSLGDPEMFFLPPVEQGLKKVVFYNTRNTAISVNYVAAIVHKNGIASFTIDGVPLLPANYITHPANSNYCVVVKRLFGAVGQHTLQSDSAFSSQVYGLGKYESYGYTGGTLVNNLNSIGTLQNVYNITDTANQFTCPNSPVNIAIQLAYKATSITWQRSQVPAMGAYADTTIANPVPADSTIINGRRYYTYPLAGDYVFEHTDTFYLPVNYSSPDIDHCTQEENVTVEIIVQKGPTPDFAVTYAGCIKDTAYLNGNPNDAVYALQKFIYGFENNTTDTALNSKTTFLTGGAHSVKFTTIATNGCFGDTTKPIATFFNPEAKFSYERTVCLGDSSRLIDASVPTGTIAKWDWDFGDGQTSSRTNGNPFYHTYAAIDSFAARLAVTSAQGCPSDTFQLKIPVAKKPTAAFTAIGSICVDSLLTFTSSSNFNGSLQQWYWDFGNGQTITNANGNPFTKSYATPQNNLLIKHVVSDGAGCVSDTATTLLANIHANPIAKFTNTTTLCPADSVLFTDNSTSATSLINQWHWNFGNGTDSIISSSAAFSYAYNTSGNFAPSLTVSTTEGCGSKPFSATVNIYPKPVASFSYLRDVCLGDSMLFTDQSTPAGITKWDWDFADGTTASKTNAAVFYHTYAAAKSYTVSLTVTSAQNCKSDVFTLPVGVNEKPKASFTTNGKPCVDSSILFTSTAAFTGTLTQWYWDFGNGQTVTNNNSNPFSKVFITPSQPFTIKHVVSDGAGCVSDTFTSQHVAINANPTAAFTVESDPFCMGKTILFTAPAGEALYEWHWDFGNGSTTSTTPSTNYIYNNAGSYTASLRVSNAGLCFSQPFSQAITILEAPKNLDAGANITVDQGMAVSLAATINNPQQNTYRWTPTTNLNNPTVLNPTVTPFETTTYTITATSLTGNCPASDTVRVTVLKTIKIPNAFSPNGDGINDTWQIAGLESYSKATVELFDRYGQRVYQTTGYSRPWNGTSTSGKILPTGVYYYIITPNANNYGKLTGSVTVLR